MKTKRDRNYSREHTIQRLRERYALEFTHGDYEALCNAATRTTSKKLIGVEPDMNQEIWDVSFCNVWIRVVWDTERRIVKTVIPNPQTDGTVS